MLQRRSVPRHATTVKGDLATYFTKFSFSIHCNSARCCTSFSTRPGKEGKKDLCLLNTIFEHQLDTLVQKGSWNYHQLNISQSEGERKCRVKRETCGSFNKNNEKIIDGLRLRKGGKVIKSQNLLSVINQSG